PARWVRVGGQAKIPAREARAAARAPRGQERAPGPDSPLRTRTAYRLSRAAGLPQRRGPPTLPRPRPAPPPLRPPAGASTERGRGGRPAAAWAPPSRSSGGG